MGNYSMGSGCRAAQNYATWTTFVVLWTSPTFRSQTWKTSQPTEIHGEVPAPVVWAHSVRCQIKQLQNADRRSSRHQRRNPTATGPRCPQCSRVCASEFGLRSHLRSHISRTLLAAQTSSSMSTDYYKARQGYVSDSARTSIDLSLIVCWTASI